MNKDQVIRRWYTCIPNNNTRDWCNSSTGRPEPISIMKRDLKNEVPSRKMLFPNNISRKNQPIIKKIHSSDSRPPTRTGYNSEISRYFNNICHKSDLLLHYFVHVLVSFTETLKRCSVTSYFYTRSVPLWTQSQLQYWSVLFLLINYFV